MSHRRIVKSGKKTDDKTSNKPFLTILFFPVGYLLKKAWDVKYKSIKNMKEHKINNDD